MKRWSARKLVALVLAVFVAVGMSVSVAQATSMSMKMATASDMMGPTHDGCPDCPDCPKGSGDDGVKVMMCSVLCTTPVLAVLPEGVSVPVVQQPVPFLVRDPFLRGTRAPPDPYPPRTTDIG